MTWPEIERLTDQMQPLPAGQQQTSQLLSQVMVSAHSTMLGGSRVTVLEAFDFLLTSFSNPARTAVTLKLPAATQARTVTVANGLGRVVRRTAWCAQTATLADLAGLAPGVYTGRCRAATVRLLVE